MKKLKNIKPGRDGIWQIIREYKKVTIPMIQEYVSMHSTSIKTYLLQLEAGGYIARDGYVGKLSAVQYILIKDNGIHRPILNADGTKQKAGANQRMWMCIKALGQFNYKQVSLAAVVSDSNAKTYLRFLERAKYIFVLKKAKASLSPTVYQFKESNNTGYRAPQIRKDKSVYDLNIHKVMYQPERGAA